MKIIIFGVNGFIGSNAFHFFKEKNEVFGCDVILDKFNFTQNLFLIDEKNPDYDRIFAVHNFDVCLNASGAASVPFSMVHPHEDFILNVLNVARILEAIRKNNPSCKYIHLSSAAVYGNPKYLPIDEKHPIQPVSPYGWHKRQSEWICKEYYEFHNIRSTILRIFSAYGEGLRKQLFWDSYQKAKTGIPIVLYETGKESRDFIYITDILRAINIIIEKARFEAEVINVATGKENTVHEAAKILFNLIDERIIYRFSGENRPGDPINWQADINVLQSWGFEPAINFEQGICNYVRWVQGEK